MKNRLLIVLAALLMATLAGGGYLLYMRGFATSFDASLKHALTALQSPHTYTMLDETHATLSGRSIDIYGVYSLDFDSRRFSAVSTTTLVGFDDDAPMKSHAFTLQHRAIGEDIYIQIGTDSAFLKKTIPYDPEWKHFVFNAIPDRFVDIAVPGPILDNLSLLGKNGAYLSLLSKPVTVTVASTTYRSYTFKLSKETVAVTEGPLKSLIDQIATGTVEIWLDETDRVYSMHMNGPNYSATSTILSVNTPVDISPPPSAE